MSPLGVCFTFMYRHYGVPFVFHVYCVDSLPFYGEVSILCPLFCSAPHATSISMKFTNFYYVEKLWDRNSYYVRQLKNAVC